MLTLFGVIILVLVSVSYGLSVFAKKAKQKNEEIKEYNSKQNDRYYHKKEIPVIEFNLPGKRWIWGIGAIILFGLNGMFFWADAGTAYAVQYPWGGDKMIKTQGLKVKAYGRLIPITYETSLQDHILTEGQSLSENKAGIINRPAKWWEFSDAIKAKIATAVVVAIDTDDELLFLDMADKNRSEYKLMYGRVIPNIEAALKNTCKLMDAQDYISGKASDFDRYFRDQLENGMYQIEEYTVENESEIIGDSTTVRKVDLKSNSNGNKKYRIKRVNGEPVRDKDSNTLTQYGMSIEQAQVTSIDWEPSFDKRLDLQKNEVAQIQLEKQQAQKEFYRAQKEKAKGEAEKATERALLEKEQIQQTIAAETKAKVAEFDLTAKKKEYEVAKYTKLKERELADAKYYTNQKLVQAGLTPQEKMDMQIQMNKDKWDNISKWNLPNFYMAGQSGSKGGEGDLLQALIGADLAKGMMTK